MKLTYLTLTVLFLVGCASAPEPKTTYLMRSDVILESREFHHTEVPVCLAQINVANYLDQPGIVTVEANGALHVSNYNLWAEPLRKSLRSFLSMELSAALREDILIDERQHPDALLVDIRIDQLHGDADGYAVLVAFWSYELSGERVEFQYTQRRPLKKDGYAALVEAQQQVLSGLAFEIGSELNARRQQAAEL
ncbi:MAG: PqiC family protein [Coraliomargarita sp.]